MCKEEERNKSGKKQEQSTSTAAAATAKKERKKKFMLLLVSCLEFLAAATATISPSCFFFFFPNYCCDAYRLNSHGGHVLWAAAEGTELDYSTSMEIAVIRQRASSLPFSSPTLLITLRQNDFFSLSLFLHALGKLLSVLLSISWRWLLLILMSLHSRAHSFHRWKKVDEAAAAAV